eukprot:scaffold13813_cov50-Attheya_sp.AAC.1
MDNNTLPTVDSSRLSVPSSSSIMSSHPSGGNNNSSHLSLSALCSARSWVWAEERARTHPSEAQWGHVNNANMNMNGGGVLHGNSLLSQASTTTTSSPITVPLSSVATTTTAVAAAVSTPLRRPSSLSSTPLALACRHGAPLDTIRAILAAAPSQLRHNAPSRGTPLHEAVSNPTCDRSVVRLLLRADHALCTSLISPDASNYNAWMTILSCDTAAPTVTTQPIHADTNNSNNNDTAGSCVPGVRALEVVEKGNSTNVNVGRINSSLSSNSSSSMVRAAMMQDVDGNTPLHLVIRRAFGMQMMPTVVGGVGDNRMDDQEEVMQMVQDVVESCPEAVGIPDRREYEESPLVKALKASNYVTAGMQLPGTNQIMMSASRSYYFSTLYQHHPFPNETNHNHNPNNNNNIMTTTHVPVVAPPTLNNEGTTPTTTTTRCILEEDDETRLQRKIYRIVKLMLGCYPRAASLVMSGASGEYTALHSAVFHGRCSDIVRLILTAHAQNRNHSITDSIMTMPSSKSALSNQNPRASPSASSLSGSYSDPALIANFQGELPLHFAAMRLESPRTVDCLCRSSPDAVSIRDSMGLTPLHWLWVRFVNTILEQFGEGMTLCRRGQDHKFVLERDSDDDIHHFDSNETNVHQSSPPLSNDVHPCDYEGFCSVYPLCATPNQTLTQHEQQDVIMEDVGTAELEESFDGDYFARIKAIDFPLDWTRMRHVPADFIALEAPCADRAAIKLGKLRERRTTRRGRSIPYRHAPQDVPCNSKKRRHSQTNDVDSDQGCYETGEKCISRSSIISANSEELGPPFYDREEAVTALFWSKAVSMLRASAHSMSLLTPHEGKSASSQDDDFLIVHTAFGTSSAPASVALIAAKLFPEQLSTRDDYGRVPLHYAARRPWHRWDPLPSPSDSLFRHGGHQFLSRRNGMDSMMENQDVPHDGGFTHQSTSVNQRASPADILHGESLMVLCEAITLSPVEAARTIDTSGRLPLHYAVDTMVRAACASAIAAKEQNATIKNGREEAISKVAGSGMSPLTYSSVPILETLRALVQMYPEALEILDKETGLCPFMQSAAVIGMCQQENPTSKNTGDLKSGEDVSNTVAQKGSNGEDLALSITFFLLRENPSLVQYGLTASSS